MKEKKKGKFKWVVIVIIAVIVIAAVSSSDEEPKKVGDVDSASSLEEKNDEKETEEAKQTEFYPGDIVEASEFKISFISAEEYISDNQFLQPKDGYKYLKFDFEFENLGDSDAYVSSFDFECYADGYECEQAYVNDEDLSATLSKGKKTKGNVVFEVPVDFEKVELEYETNFWTENKVVFVVNGK